MDINFKYEGIGFNGPHLAKMDFETFTREVKHLFPGEKGPNKIKELYGLLQAKYQSGNPSEDIIKGKPQKKEVDG